MIADIKDIFVPLHYVKPFKKKEFKEPKVLYACKNVDRAPSINSKMGIKEVL